MSDPLPCPFCGKQPKVMPSNPKMDGNAWGAVACVNRRCPAQPQVNDGALGCDERGSDAYKASAIRRWNMHRSRASQAPAIEE